jgi:hypothetical protein
MILLFVCAQNNLAYPIAIFTNHNSENDTIVTEIYSIPSPEEIMYYINNGEIHYQSDLLSNNNHEHFIDYQEYLILGSNLADLSYCVYLGQKSKVLTYFQTISVSAKRLNLLTKDIETIKERFERNLLQIDSLKEIYEEVYDLMMKQLNESKRYNHYTIVSLGIFVESIYLILNSSKLENSNKQFKRRVGDQQYILIQINEMIDRYLDNSNKLKYKKELELLNLAFQKYSVKAASPTSRLRYDGTIVISASKEKEDLKNRLFELKKEIESVRNKLIVKF